MKKSSVHDTTAPIIFVRPTPAETAMAAATCDKVRDPFKDDPEFAGRAVWTCNKTAGHDNRGAHRMVDATGPHHRMARRRQ